MRARLNINSLARAASPPSAGAVLLACAVVLLAACGGRSQPPAPSALPAAPPAGLVQFFSLPAVEALKAQPAPAAPPHQVSAGFTSSLNYGGDFNGLPHSAVEANPSIEGVFSPQYDPQADPLLNEPAYAGYYYYGLDEFSGPPQLILEWSVPPAPGCLWVALANFVRGTWDWFALDSGVLTTLSVDSLAPYIRPADSYLYLYVVLTGTQAANLQYVVLGQSAAPSLTIYTNLSGTPPNGLAPLSVEYNFSTGTPGSLVAGFDVDWEGDGTLDELGLNDSVPIHVFDPGTFTTTVTLHTSDGQSATDTYNFVAKDPDNQPPVAALAAIPDGSGFYSVTLDASLSTDDDTIIAYEWDVDADPWADITTAIPELPYVFCNSGAQTVSVTVRDNDLAGSTASRSFTLGNALGTTALAAGFSTAPQCSLALSTVGVSALRPGVAWFDMAAHKLYYQQGNANGSVWGAVQQPTGGTLNAGWGVSLAALPAAGNNWPNLVYGSGEFNTDYVLRYRYALNEDGTDWSDEVAIGSLAHLGGQNRLLNVNGKPAVASVHKWDYSGVAEIYYSAAGDAAGTSWGSLKKIAGPLAGNFGDFQVLSNGSHLLLGYTHDPQLNALGETMEYAFGDYDPVAASFTERYRTPLPRAFWLALDRLADNRPALQAGRRYQNPSGCWMVATAPVGNAWNAPLELGPEGYGGAGTFIIYDGKPLLVYLSYSHGLVLRFAADDAGTDWTPPVLIAPDASLNMRPQAVLLNGAPLIVYYNGQTKELLAAYVGP